MKHLNFAWLAVLVASIAAASLAATASATPAAKGVTPANQAAGTLQVRFAVQEFGHGVGDAVFGRKVVDGEDVGM